MSGYLLKATDRKGPANYVNHPGSHKSYTTRASARVFPTKAAAEADACGNERAVPK